MNNTFALSDAAAKIVHVCDHQETGLRDIVAVDNVSAAGHASEPS